MQLDGALVSAPVYQPRGDEGEERGEEEGLARESPSSRSQERRDREQSRRVRRREDPERENGLLRRDLQEPDENEEAARERDCRGRPRRRMIADAAARQSEGEEAGRDEREQKKTFGAMREEIARDPGGERRDGESAAIGSIGANSAPRPTRNAPAASRRR